MNWKFEPKTGSYSYDEFNGAYGYAVMPYTNAHTGVRGYALYFKNAWRTDRPLGEYIDTDGNLSSIFSEPSLGLRDEFIFNTYEEATLAAEKHKTKGEEPTSYEEDYTDHNENDYKVIYNEEDECNIQYNDLDDVEEPNILYND